MKTVVCLDLCVPFGLGFGVQIEPAVPLLAHVQIEPAAAVGEDTAAPAVGEAAPVVGDEAAPPAVGAAPGPLEQAWSKAFENESKALSPVEQAGSVRKH